MSCGGFGRLDGGCEDGLVLLSYCSDGPLLGDFANNNGFLYGGSRSGFILGVEGSPGGSVGVAGDRLGCPDGGQKDGGLHVLHNSDKGLLFAFSVTSSFSDSGSQLGSVGSVEDSLIEATTRLEAA